MSISYSNIDNSPLHGGVSLPDRDATYTAFRCFVWSGAAPSAVTPAAGADVDGVAAPDGGGAATNFTPAMPGVPVRVEAGAAFSSGAALETLADGRVQTKASGIGVLRALQGAAGAGSIVWAVFTSGR